MIQYVAKTLDLIAVATGALLAYQLRTWPVPVDPVLYSVATILGIFYVFAGFPLFGLYREKYFGLSLVSLSRVAMAWGMVLILLVVTAFLLKISAYYSRIWFLMWATYALSLILLFRAVFYLILNSARVRGWNRIKVLVVGTPDLSSKVTSQLNESKWSGLDVIGHVVVDTIDVEPDSSQLSVLGLLPELESIVTDYEVGEVWITLSLKSEETIKQIIHLLRHSTVNIRMVPDLFNLRLINHSITEIAGIPVLNLCESPMSGVNRYIKISEDKLISCLVLLLFLPVIILIALTIKLKCKGPVFYSQKRVGWNGRVFSILKFRTMPEDVEKESGPIWAQADDSRATGFGSFLRRTSLDELPQFINVLKGDMSIVGPRPERPMFVEEFKEQVPDYMKKHMVKAGITGWAQVNGWRGSTDLSKRIEYDLFYIENWSLLFDFKIMFLTLIRGFVHRNAY